LGLIAHVQGMGEHAALRRAGHGDSLRKARFIDIRRQHRRARLRKAKGHGAGEARAGARD
jgi:hypothetical protein